MQGAKNYQAVTRDIRANKLSAAYLIYGTETFLIDSLLQELSEKFLGDVHRETNYFVRYAPETSLEEVIALSSGGGLFSAQKMIVYKDYQNTRNPNLKALLRYLKNPDPNICLVIIARTDKISGAKYDKLSPHLEVIQISAMRDAALQAFVVKESERHGKKITSEAVEALIYLVGDSLHNLQTQIAQIAQYCKDEEKIDVKHLEEVVSVFANQNIFQLSGEIMNGNLDKSLFVLHNLLNKGESAHSILFMLLRHVLMLIKIQGYVNSGVGDYRKIQRELKLFPKHFEEYKRQLNKWSLKALHQALFLLKETDRALKSGEGSPDLLLDILTYRLVNFVK